MLLSKLLGERLRSKPADASLISHIFLLRGGYIRNVGSGIFSLLPPALKIQKKIEAIIRDEMDKIDGQEILLPVVLPAELWKQSGRFETVGNELLRFKDRAERDMVLAMTHEEAVVHLLRSEAKSYLNYPVMVYQIQTKFRDEPRARGGLIRVREFTMKDAYSFHTSQEDLNEYYEKVYNAYFNIFKRVGLPEVIAIKSDTGMMGGSGAHEFMLLSDAGEDSIVICDECGYKANMEVAVSKIEKNEEEEKKLTEIFTPGSKTIEDLIKFDINESKVIKAVLFEADGYDKPVAVFIRGDLEVNEAKLKNYLNAEIQELKSLEKYNLVPGYIGPIGDTLNICNPIFDVSLQNEKNMVCAANKKDYHLSGFSVDRDTNIKNFVDVSKVKEGHCCIKCGAKLKVKRGIEVGNIFKLGTKYTKSMNMTYVNNESKEKNPIMGCYGIGIGRLLACVVEKMHDDFGPIWPKNITPWQVHICALNMSIEEIKDRGFYLYKKLSEKFDVIFDDRNLAAGAQFADADLLGVPVRVIVSKKNISSGKVEVKLRGEKESKLMDDEELFTFLSDFYFEKGEK